MFEHRRFDGVEKDSAWLYDALPSFVEVYAKLVSSPDHVKAANVAKVEANNVFVKAMAVLALKITVDSWSVPLGIVPVQTFSVHVIYFFSYVYKDARPSRRC